MAKAIQQIKQELAALEDKVTILADELRSFYERYFNSLSQSIRKQLIGASYQICTQAYPDLFLKLSFSQRQKLQEDIRELGRKVQPQLLSYLETPQPQSPSPPLNIMEQMLINLPVSEAESLAKPELIPNQESSITNPEQLVHWCKKIEQGINETLERLSQAANHCLQTAQVLPAQLPAKVLEMAIQAEEEGAPISGSPNLLNLLMESDDEEEEKDSDKPAKVTKIIAIHLRISEIEFADPTLSIERKQVRNLLETLSKLRHQYRQKQRELSTAEAASAWRATWFED